MPTVTVEDVEPGQTVIVTVIQDSYFIDDEPEPDEIPEDTEQPRVWAVSQ